MGNSSDWYLCKYCNDVRYHTGFVQCKKCGESPVCDDCIDDYGHKYTTNSDDYCRLNCCGHCCKNKKHQTRESYIDKVKREAVEEYIHQRENMGRS